MLTNLTIEKQRSKTWNTPDLNIKGIYLSPINLRWLFLDSVVPLQNSTNDFLENMELELICVFVCLSIDDVLHYRLICVLVTNSAYIAFSSRTPSHQRSLRAGGTCCRSEAQPVDSAAHLHRSNWSRSLLTSRPASRFARQAPCITQIYNFHSSPHFYVLCIKFRVVWTLDGLIPRNPSSFTSYQAQVAMLCLIGPIEVEWFSTIHEI